jgi:hypothetical protein
MFRLSGYPSATIRGSFIGNFSDLKEVDLNIRFRFMCAFPDRFSCVLVLKSIGNLFDVAESFQNKGDYSSFPQSASLCRIQQ